MYCGDNLFSHFPSVGSESTACNLEDTHEVKSPLTNACSDETALRGRSGPTFISSIGRATEANADTSTSELQKNRSSSSAEERIIK